MSSQQPDDENLLALCRVIAGRDLAGVGRLLDSSPELARASTDAQRSTVEYLISQGADPNSFDNSGVCALHRAVRTRSAAAVSALLDGGADVRLQNKAGSTPLHLAVQNTGRSDSGSAAAKDQQLQIVRLLLQRGAKPTDTDFKGKAVGDAATNHGLRALLARHPTVP